MKNPSKSEPSPERARQLDVLSTSEDAIQRSLKLLKDTAPIISAPVLALRPASPGAAESDPCT